MRLTSEELRDSFKYLFPDELPALKELVTWLPNQNPLVINIGAGAGTSGLAIMEARPDSHLITIDITDASSPFGCLEAERDVFRRAGYLHTLYTRWIQIHHDSSKVGREWVLLGNDPLDRTNPFTKNPDMVFVDGEHSYEGCKADIEAWLPLIKPGGIIAVHDYGKAAIPPNPNGPHPVAWPGVDQAVDELLLYNPELFLCMRVDSLIAFRIPVND